jgi:hypothetical protein
MSRTTTYKLTEVNNPQLIKKFLDFPARLYKSEKNWIRPLDEDVEAIFDPKKNKLFRQGAAIRWILKDEQDNTVGRAAAFYNAKTAKANDQPTGGLGFFDCIDDKDAAKVLFDAAKKWNREQGMEAMDGPVNFGDRDSFWGCLVDGFYEPLYNMPFNFPYYKDLFEGYGFQEYFQQYTYHRTFKAGGVEEVVKQKAERIFSNPDYSFKTMNWKNSEKFAEDFMVIFNKGWARFPGVKAISKLHAVGLLKQMKPIMDTQLVIFTYHKDDPIAFFIMMPDISQIMRKFNGKFNWFNKLRFMFDLKVRKSCTRVIGRIFGIVPEFQSKGIEAGMIMEFAKNAFKPSFPYTDLEMNWIGDFNPSMMKMVEQIGGKVRKTHLTFRYLFDRNKPFERAKRVNV